MSWFLAENKILIKLKQALGCSLQNKIKPIILNLCFAVRKKIMKENIT
jgi:hypothetical protein